MILPNPSFGVAESRQAKAKHSADQSWLFLPSHKLPALHDQVEIDDLFEKPLFTYLPYLSQYRLSSSILGSRSFAFARPTYAFSLNVSVPLGKSWRNTAKCNSPPASKFPSGFPCVTLAVILLRTIELALKSHRKNHSLFSWGG